MPFDSVRLVMGDTDRIPRGEGTHASRSVIFAGPLIVQNAGTIVEEAKRLAALKLEVTEADTQLYAEADYTIPDATYPSGTHICEVEVNAETGRVRIDRFTALDDIGRAVNPMILAGQSQGGIA